MLDTALVALVDILCLEERVEPALQFNLVYLAARTASTGSSDERSPPSTRCLTSSCIGPEAGESNKIAETGVSRNQPITKTVSAVSYCRL